MYKAAVRGYLAAAAGSGERDELLITSLLGEGVENLKTELLNNNDDIITDDDTKEMLNAAVAMLDAREIRPRMRS
ncbi:hypothetical protein AGMMS49921_10720 [Endomicrobiia bacterium]|nr:hypothetical protein AGMMS49921_10720 [Endomicrobiia bacterium]